MSNIDDISNMLKTTNLTPKQKKQKRQFQHNINQFTHVAIIKGPYKGQIAEIKMVLSKVGRMQVLLESSGKSIFLNPDQYLLIKNRILYGQLPFEKNTSKPEDVKMTFAQEFRTGEFNYEEELNNQEDDDVDDEANIELNIEEPDSPSGSTEFLPAFNHLQQVAIDNSNFTPEEQKIYNYLDDFFRILQVEQFLTLDEVMNGMKELQKQLQIKLKNKNDERLLLAGTIYFILNMNKNREPIIDKNLAMYETLLLDNKFVTGKGKLTKFIKALANQNLGTLPEINEPRRRIQSELELFRPQDVQTAPKKKSQYKTRKYVQLTPKPKAQQNLKEVKLRKLTNEYKKNVIDNILNKGTVFSDKKRNNDFILKNIRALTKLTTSDLKAMKTSSNSKQIELLIMVNDQLEQMLWNIDKKNKEMEQINQQLSKMQVSPKRRRSVAEQMEAERGPSNADLVRERIRNERDAKLLSEHLKGREDEEYERVLINLEKEVKAIDTEVKKLTSKLMNEKQISKVQELLAEKRQLKHIINTRDISEIQKIILNEIKVTPELGAKKRKV